MLGLVVGAFSVWNLAAMTGVGSGRIANWREARSDLIWEQIFHELAHQVVFAKDDTMFNESFATAVERIGVRRWLDAEAPGEGSLAVLGITPDEKPLAVFKNKEGEVIWRAGQDMALAPSVVDALPLE